MSASLKNQSRSFMVSLVFVEILRDALQHVSLKADAVKNEFDIKHKCGN